MIAEKYDFNYFRGGRLSGTVYEKAQERWEAAFYKGHTDVPGGNLDAQPPVTDGGAKNLQRFLHIYGKL